MLVLSRKNNNEGGKQFKTIFIIIWKLMRLISCFIEDPTKRVKDNMDLAKVMSRAILQRQNASDSYGAKTLEKNQDNLDVE